MKKNQSAGIELPTFLTVPEAAKYCGVSRNTMYVWVREGRIEAYQTPGRRNLIRPSHLLLFMRSKGIEATSALRALARRDERLRASDLSAQETVADIELNDDDAASRRLLTGPEAAKICSVNRYTMWRWIREDKIPAMMALGEIYLIRPDHLAGFMEESHLFVPPALRAMAQVYGSAGKDEQVVGSTVLVVDTDPLTRRFAVRSFGETMHVLEAGDGESALRMLFTHDEIDLVHLNLQSLEKGGFRTLTEALRLRPQVPVITLFEDEGHITEELVANKMVIPLAEKPLTREVLESAAAEASRTAASA